MACPPSANIQLYGSSILHPKGKQWFYIFKYASRKPGIWAAKNPDKIGVFAEHIFFMFLLWRRVRDSNPRFLLGTRHFECRTFDLSDNSPYISSVILAPEECKKNTQERYEIVKSEPTQSPVRRTFSADETAGASKNFECGPFNRLGTSPYIFACF